MSYGNGGLGQIDTRYAGAQTVSAPPPVSIGVPQALDDQGQRLNEVHQALNELEKRLGCVLAPAPTSTDKSRETPQSSQIVARIMEHNSGLSAAREHIVSILERLQL